MSGNKEDAIAILKSDHAKVKGLFEQFENTAKMREKKKIAAEAIMELKLHAEIEEKIFYPVVRKKLDEENIMNEADEEHHVAKLLIGELDQMDGSEDHWAAKFIVLAENIRHHIKEEEGEMFPKARKKDIDFVAIGQKLLAIKQQLKKTGVPDSLEGKLMVRGFKADSPAMNAKNSSAEILPYKTAKKSATAKKGASHQPRKAS